MLVKGARLKNANRLDPANPAKGKLLSWADRRSNSAGQGGLAGLVSQVSLPAILPTIAHSTNQVLLDGYRHRLGPARSLQFGQDVADVGFGRSRADIECSRDLRIVQTLYQ